MQQYGSNDFACRPPSPLPQDPGDGVKRSKFSFSEHGHVAYINQMESRNVATCMVANILPQTIHYYLTIILKVVG